MPTINKGKRISNYVKHDKSKDIYNLVYNTVRWRKLRDNYLMFHPLCEMCEKEGKTTIADEVHHIKPISTGQNELEYIEIGFNPNNLMALCEKHHHELHKKKP